MTSHEPVDILIVDDRPDKLLALEAILSPLKESIVKAASGKEALRLLLKQEFAVLLLDVQMPDMDGFETASLIRQNDRTRSLPIIFISAFEATAEKLERVYSLGAVDYVPTPAPEALRAKVAVFADLYRKNRALQKLIAEMTEKTNQLNGFCYTVAHDLRAPLRAINGYAHLLREEYASNLQDQGKDCLDRIAASSRRLDQLIQDLLGYCRMEQMQLTAQEVDLEKVVETTLKHVEAEIKNKGAEVSVKHPLPKVLGDPGALEHVLFNLMSNALKFSRSNIPPKIDIYGEDKGKKVRIWVQDNGIGIAARYHQRIFSMFEKLDHGVNSPGNGVGLAIVSKAIERLGGTTGVESEVDVGSRFWIELPEV
jgi:signal transduction histidine kinase